MTGERFIAYTVYMIAKLTGTISDKLQDSLIIDISGIGYEVFVPLEDWGGAKQGSSVSFYIYDHIREDLHVLYGFGELDAKQLFIQLIGISGIGPKVAMAVLSATSITRLKQAIVAGDPDLLRGVSGVGKKTAERIVVELRGKIKDTVGTPVSSGDNVYQALISLGYNSMQAQDAVAAIPQEITGEADRIKAALKVVGT